MGNCIRRHFVHPADLLDPASPHDYKVIVTHNEVCPQPMGTKGVDTRIRYKRLDLLSWLIALQVAKPITGYGRIVSLVFYAFLQVPSVADMRELLPALRHVRSIDIYSGCTGDDAKRENFGALAQFLELLDSRQEFRAIVPNDFDWTLLDEEAFRALRKLEFSAIGDDVPMRSANRRLLEDRIVAFCADPHIFYAGEAVETRFLGWNFGSAFIRRLSKTHVRLQKSKGKKVSGRGGSQVNIKVEIQGRDKARVRATGGFVRTKKDGGRQRTKKGGGKFSVSVADDIATIIRVRGW